VLHPVAGEHGVLTAVASQRDADPELAPGPAEEVGETRTVAEDAHCVRQLCMSIGKRLGARVGGSARVPRR
jgi:hypothetical protein